MIVLQIRRRFRYSRGSPKGHNCKRSSKINVNSFSRMRWRRSRTSWESSRLRLELVRIGQVRLKDREYHISKQIE